MKRTIVLTVFIATCIVASSAAATDYLFHVGCSNRQLVAKWSTGTVDPGKEYLRTVTGTKFPDCSITDYDSTRDAGLPVETYSHEGGVIAGIPFVGSIICGIFGC